MHTTIDSSRGIEPFSISLIAHASVVPPAGSVKMPSVRAIAAGLEFPELVKPNTIAKSLAIGNPADGFQVIKVVNETGGSAAMVTDDEILDAIQLLASTEGIFTEPAGGTTLAATIELIRRGVIGPGESTVVCITGNGYKTTDVVSSLMTEPVRLGRGFKEFEGWLESRQALA